MLAELDERDLVTLQAAVRDQWSRLDETVAVLVELVSVWRIEWLGAHSKKGSRLPRPIQVERPGDEAAKPLRPSDLFRRLLRR